MANLTIYHSELNLETCFAGVMAKTGGQKIVEYEEQCQ